MIDPLLPSASGLGGVAPDDDPADWIFSEDSCDQSALRALAKAIVELDPELTEILVNNAVGWKSAGELVRKLDAWQASMGEGATSRPPEASSVSGVKPWLI